MTLAQTEETPQRDMVSLESTIGEGIVLLDGSARSRKPGECFLRKLYDANLYNQLDLSEIFDELGSVQEISGILNSGRVFTTHGVAAEFFEYVRILGEKIKSIRETQTLFGDKQERDPCHMGNMENGREAIEELHNQAYSTYRQMVSKIIPVSYLGGKSRHEMMKEMTQILEEELRLKKDKGYLLGEHDTDRAKESHTDEELVATAFCASMYTKCPIKILARDTDFVSLVSVLSKLLAAECFMPYNNQFRDALRLNPVVLYLRDGEAYDRVINTSEVARLIFPRQFKISTISVQRSEQIRAKIECTWEKWVNYSFSSAA